MRTTLNKIREQSPCMDGWSKLLKSLDKTKADDEPVSIVQIIDSNGLDDALWCLRAVEGRDREIRHYMVWCARQVQHLMNDPRSKDALQMAEWFADGLATQQELSAAWSAALSAAWSAAESAAESAAWSAAWSAARSAEESAALSAAWLAARSAAESAAESAARSAAESAQEKKLRELCAWCDQNLVLAGIGE